MRQFDPGSLHETLDRYPPHWSLPSQYAVTGVHHGYRCATATRDAWRFVLDSFDPVRDAQMTCLDPGGFLVPHCDRGPWFERWHVPIWAAGWFQQQDDPIAPVEGVPFEVAHWLRHSVWNPTSRARIHLVIDRDIPIDRPSAPLRLFPIPSRFAHLVAAAKEA